jgi:hypothetical protein
LSADHGKRSFRKAGGLCADLMQTVLLVTGNKNIRFSRQRIREDLLVVLVP